jgi:hypothetical protein
MVPMSKMLRGLIIAIGVLTANIGMSAIITNPVYAQERPKFTIVNYDTFTDENGFLNIVGFIKNTGENAGLVPTMKLSLFNKQEERISNFKRDPLVQFMNPDAVAPFKITVTDTVRSKQTANFKIAFLQKFPAQLMNPKPTKLIIDNVKFSTDLSDVTRITGDIRNDGTKATDTFTLAIAFMNDKNQVLDVKSAQYDTQTATGATVTFSFEYNGHVDKYCLVTDSRYYVAEPAGQCKIDKTTVKPQKEPKVPKLSNDTGVSQQSKETVKLSKFRVLDANQTKLRSIHVGEEVQLQSTVASNFTSDQPFTYIVQIKDEDGITVMLAWVDGELLPKKPSDLAISWTPEEHGKYNVEIFIWKALTDPVPSAEPIRTSIEVKEVKEIKEAKKTDKLDSK